MQELLHTGKLKGENFSKGPNYQHFIPNEQKLQSNIMHYEQKQ